MSHDGGTIFGENQAYSRLLKELHQTNPEGIQYPKATNDRGHEGGPISHRMDSHKKREHHAMGDSIGREPRKPILANAFRGMAEKHAKGEMVGKMDEPGEGMQKAMKRGGHRNCYAMGEKVPESAEQPGQKFKRGGKAHHKHHRHHHEDGDAA